MEGWQGLFFGSCFGLLRAGVSFYCSEAVGLARAVLRCVCGNFTCDLIKGFSLGPHHHEGFFFGGPLFQSSKSC